MRGVGPLADRTPPPAVEPQPQPGGLPRWFWLLPLLVAAAWWPIAPFWASDDYFALHYARDFDNVLADFVGPQYAAHDLFFFYRPLITLSLWVDVQLGGGAPFLAHLDNVLVHAGSALLVGCLWRRLLGDGPAFCAGLLWALSPMHIGGIGWAVGRTDGFSTALGLLCVLLLQRWLERCQRTRWPSLLAMLAALLCKETAMCLPGLIALVAFAQPADTRAGHRGCAARLRAAAVTAWPHALLLLAYLAWRIAVLGRMGGYDAAVYQPVAMAQGLGTYALDLLNPVRWVSLSSLLPAAVAAAPWLPWLGFAPAVLLLLHCSRSGRRLPVLAGVGWFALASVPLAGFFAQADNHHNLRYFCLAFAAAPGFLVAGGRLAILCAFAVFVPPLLQVRLEQWRADRTCASMHGKLVQQLDDGMPGPWFVAGLPHQNGSGTALMFHFGIDRMLQPPFANGGVRVFAHRPIFDLPGIARLVDDDGLPIALPAGTTLLFRGPELLTTVPAQRLADLPLRSDPIVDVTSPQLWKLNRGEIELRIATPGVRTQALRLVVFTATGYLGAAVENHAPANAADGYVDLLRFFQQARWSDGRPLINGLEPSTIMDLSTAFPVLVEGGEVRSGAFRPTHRAQRLLTFQFDRGLPALLRGEPLR